MKHYLLLALTLGCTLLTRAQFNYNAYQKDPGAISRERFADFQKLSLDVRFEPEKGLVKGTVTHTFSPLRKTIDSLYLDGPGIRVSKATLDGKEVTFKTYEQGLTFYFSNALPWNKTYTLVIQYEANPRRGIYFIGWNDLSNRSRKQIWTQGQGIDHRHWFPLFDDMGEKVITETNITFDSKYKVLSNGRKLEEKSNKDGTKTWRYAMSKPHAPYLLMLAIGDYAIKTTKTKRGTTVNFWYYPDQPERLEPSSRYTEDMITFLEDETGIPYPWESYSQVMVQDFIYGAMENTTATIFGDFFNVDARAYLDGNYVGVNCHELTHQWFGDFITARNSSDTWLQESYATYYAKLFNLRVLGQDAYDWQRRGEQNAALEASKKDLNPVRHTAGGTTRVYPKGSFIIGMLRDVVGEEHWKKGLLLYLQRHAYANVESNDMLQAFSDATGMNLAWFFDQWLYRGGEPHYQVNFEEQTVKGTRQTVFTVKQVHEMSELVRPFRMPIDFQVFYKDGSNDRLTAWVEGMQSTVIVPNPNAKEIDFVLFDPNNKVMKQVSFAKTTAMLLAQAEKAPSMLDRYDALLALKNISLEEKKATLLRCYGKESFHATKAEILAQLKTEVRDQEVKDAFRKAFADKDVQVRAAALANTDTKTFFSETLGMLQDSSYKNVQAALEKLCLEQPVQANVFLEATKGIDGMNKALKIKWLELHYFSTANSDLRKEDLALLADYASGAFEFRTRINAFNAIKSIGVLNEKILEGLFNAAMGTNGRLATPAVSTIEYFQQQYQYREMIRSWAEKQRFDAKQMEILKKAGVKW